MKLYNKPAHELHEMLAKKEISSMELTKDGLYSADAAAEAAGLGSAAYFWRLKRRFRL